MRNPPEPAPSLQQIVTQHRLPAADSRRKLARPHVLPKEIPPALDRLNSPWSPLQPHFLQPARLPILMRLDVAPPPSARRQFADGLCRRLSPRASLFNTTTNIKARPDPPAPIRQDLLLWPAACSPSVSGTRAQSFNYSQAGPTVKGQSNSFFAPEISNGYYPPSVAFVWFLTFEY